MATAGLRTPSKAPTVQFAKTAREPGKYFDRLGLFLRVQPNDQRKALERIVVRGKRSDLRLGSPSPVSSAKAHEAALNNRKLAWVGGDPLQARTEAEAMPTFEAAVRKMNALPLPTWRNPKHTVQMPAMPETRTFPRMGNLRLVMFGRSLS